MMGAAHEVGRLLFLQTRYAAARKIDGDWARVPEAAEKLNFEPAREGHEFIRAAKSLKMDARFSA